MNNEPAKNRLPNRKLREERQEPRKRGGTAMHRDRQQRQPPCSSSSAVANQLNNLVKDLRRSAHALRCPPADSANTPASFYRDSLWPAVKAFLEARYMAYQARCNAARAGRDPNASPIAVAPLRVRVVGLGIGPFTRKESRTSFLQMATFLAIRSSCIDCLAHCAAKDRKSREPTSGEETEENCGGTFPAAEKAPVVETLFFEPLCVDALHGECCRRLDIAVETVDRLGAYSPSGEASDVLVLFMPHCPWVLVHNTLLANWPNPSTQAGEASKSASDTTETAAGAQTDVLPLRNLLLIANDLRNAPLLPASETAGKGKPWTVHSQGLVSFLHVVELFPAYKNSGLKKNSKKKIVLTADSAEDHEEGSAGLSGLSRNDLIDAFIDIAVMSLTESCADDEVKQKLIHEGKGKSHAMIRKAPELIAMIEKHK